MSNRPPQPPPTMHPAKKAKEAHEVPAAASVGPPGVDMAMHRQHRMRVVDRLKAVGDVPDGSLVLMQGGPGPQRDETDHEPIFRQESSFQYLFGVREPDCYGVIHVDSGATTLYVPRLPLEYETWMGDIHEPKHFRSFYGVDGVLYVDELKASISSALGAQGRIYVSCGYNHDGKASSVPANFDGLHTMDGRVDKSSQLYDSIVHCRVIKSQKEILLMAHINNLSSEAHFEVMRSVRPGMFEYQLESMFRHWVYFHGGCRHTAYTSICGCGPNSAVLHYGHAGAPNDRKIEDGEILLLDMGGEYHCYASDITCSFPSNGVFTSDQRLIFEAVAAMQFAVFDAMKPGVPWKSMHELSYRVLCEKLSAGGLLRGEVNDMMACNVGSYFMPHGLGHLLGLDTHDVGGYISGIERDQRPGYSSLRCGRNLEEGMCITVEPGIYFIRHLLKKAESDPFVSDFFMWDVIERFRTFGGVRLEDNVIVTENGIRNLTNCPR